MAVHRDAVPNAIIVSYHYHRNRDKPYRVQFVSQPLFSTLASNKIFQDLESLLITCFNSLRIVKNITLVIGEHNLVVDAVLASLASYLVENRHKHAVTDIH